jgi:hypothetical protein
MGSFQDEILDIACLLYSNGERILETESFILEFYKMKTSNSDVNWRKKLASFLEEEYSNGCSLDILDKRSNAIKKLYQLKPVILRTLYMEILTSLDLNKNYQVFNSDEHILCSVSVTDEPINN